MRSLTKFGRNQFKRFDVNWIQTNNKQTSKVYFKELSPPPASKNNTPLTLSVPGTVSRAARANNFNPENIPLSVVNWNSIIRNCYTLVQDKPNIQVLEPTELFKFYWFPSSIWFLLQFDQLYRPMFPEQREVKLLSSSFCVK